VSRARTAVDVLRRALREARDDDIATLAQALAFSLFLAIPATALVVLGAFSLAAGPDDVQRLVDEAGRIMPAETTTLLQDSLERSARSTGGSIAMTLAGLALAVWSTTSAATMLMRGITRAYDREDERGFLHKRLIALAIVLALVLGAALVVVFLVLGPHLQRWLGSALEAETLTTWVWWTAQWPILLGALLFAFAVVLYLGPGGESPGWKLVVPGALVAVVVWLVASAGFAFYAANFGSYNKSWGTLSAVVVTLVWLWLTCAALLFGAEVNAEAARSAEETPRA
jgi:membrane protein